MDWQGVLGWMLLAAGAVLWILWLSRAIWRRGCCPACGYSRRGIDVVAPCPECGLIRSFALRKARRRRRLLLWPGLVLIALGGLVGPLWPVVLARVHLMPDRLLLRSIRWLDAIEQVRLAAGFANAEWSGGEGGGGFGASGQSRCPPLREALGKELRWRLAEGSLSRSAASDLAREWIDQWTVWEDIVAIPSAWPDDEPLRVALLDPTFRGRPLAVRTAAKVVLRVPGGPEIASRAVHPPPSPAIWPNYVWRQDPADATVPLPSEGMINGRIVLELAVVESGGRDPVRLSDGSGAPLASRTLSVPLPASAASPEIAEEVASPGLDAVIAEALDAEALPGEAIAGAAGDLESVVILLSVDTGRLPRELIVAAEVALVLGDAEQFLGVLLVSRDAIGSGSALFELTRGRLPPPAASSRWAALEADAAEGPTAAALPVLRIRGAARWAIRELETCAHGCECWRGEVRVPIGNWVLRPEHEGSR